LSPQTSLLGDFSNGAAGLFVVSCFTNRSTLRSRGSLPLLDG
jgi:hypothetical protein